MFRRSKVTIVLHPKTIFKQRLEEDQGQEKEAKNHSFGMEVSRFEASIGITWEDTWIP